MIRNINRVQKIINMINAKKINYYKIENNVIKWFNDNEMIEATFLDTNKSAKTFVNKIRYRVGTRSLNLKDSCGEM